MPMIHQVEKGINMSVCEIFLHVVVGVEGLDDGHISLHDLGVEGYLIEECF